MHVDWETFDSSFAQFSTHDCVANARARESSVVRECSESAAARARAAALSLHSRTTELSRARAFATQSWVENCANDESKVSQSTCNGYIYEQCRQASTRTDFSYDSESGRRLDEPEEVNAYDSEALTGDTDEHDDLEHGTEQVAGRELWHKNKKHRTKKNVCANGKHNCATNLCVTPSRASAEPLSVLQLS